MSEKIPEDKTQRLASLNQDVFAVSPKPVSSAKPQAAPPPRARPQNPQPAAVPSRPPMMGAEPAPTTLPQSLLIGMMVLAVLVVGGIGGGVVLGFSLLERVSMLETESAALSTTLSRVDQRVAALEGQLAAAEQDTSNMGEEEQANILQFTSRLRKVALDVTRTNADLARLQKRLNEVGTLAEQTSSVSSEQASRIASLASQVANLPLQSGAAPAQPASVTDAQAREQIQSLQTRLDRMANDIRSIYRLLEQSR